MDSLTHVALGSAIGMAAMGRRTALWKAALVGAVCNTLPDLDVFIRHGDPILDMVSHRGASHSIVYLSLLAPLIAWGLTLIQRNASMFGRWWLMVWLALISHPLLDVMTVYGTQLALPFSDRPYAVGSIFIIDPMVTLPLLLGAGVALALRNERGLNWNATGLVLSAIYLGWCVAAQQMVTAVAEVSLRAQGVVVRQMLVTPTPLNSVLWRVVAITPQGFREGFYSLADDDHRVVIDAFPRGEAIYEAWRSDINVQRIARFSQGIFKMSETDGRVMITDLRMGQEPSYTFSFVVGRREGAQSVAVKPEQRAGRMDIPTGLSWIWRRAQGERLPPPRATGATQP